MKKYYIINHGWGTKYIWLDWLQKVDPYGPSFREIIKKGNGEFGIYSGVIFGDSAGSTSVIHLYSEKFIKLLEKNGIKINKWLIKLNTNTKKKIKSPIPNFYYIETISNIFYNDWSSIYRYENNHNKRKERKNELSKWYNNKSDVYCYGYKDNISTWYFNMSSWDGSDLFGVKDCQIIIVTEKLKRIIEKEKLKNIKFEELKLLSEEELKNEIEVFETR
jgi:hypothetical protein